MSTALWVMFWAVALMGILIAGMMGCGPAEIAPANGDNMKCRCVDLDEFFIRGRIRSGVTLRGGKVRVTGEDLDCDLDCEVDRVEATAVE